MECNKCKEIKSSESFYHYLHKNGSTYHKQPCKKCYDKKSVILNRKYRKGNNKFHKKQWLVKKDKMNKDSEYKSKIAANKKKYFFDNLKVNLMKRALQRAKKVNLEFNLKEEDIQIPELCPILKVPFIIGVKGNYKYTYSLDRIDSSKGYIKGNVKVISMLANTMKNSASKEELKAFSENILSYINEDIVWPANKEEIAESKDKEL